MKGAILHCLYFIVHCAFLCESSVEREANTRSPLPNNMLSRVQPLSISNARALRDWSLAP